MRSDPFFSVSHTHQPVINDTQPVPLTTTSFNVTILAYIITPLQSPEGIIF